ncbi:MAG: hypothetical protein AAGC56_05820 [Pseudomonadota bacterium]
MIEKSVVLEAFDRPSVEIDETLALALADAEARVDAARAEGFEEGRAAGEAAAQAEADDGAAAAAAVRKAVADAVKQIKPRAEQELEAIVRTTLAALAPALLDVRFEAELADFVRAVRSPVAEGAMTVRVAADYAARMQTVFAAEIADGLLEITADADLEGRRARAAWSEGGAEFDLETPLAALLAAVGGEALVESEDDDGRE